MTTRVVCGAEAAAVSDSSSVPATFAFELDEITGVTSPPTVPSKRSDKIVPHVTLFAGEVLLSRREVMEKVNV